MTIEKAGNLILSIGQFESPIITVTIVDDLIFRSNDLFKNEATLTGEKFPMDVRRKETLLKLSAELAATITPGFEALVFKAEGTFLKAIQTN